MSPKLHPFSFIHLFVFFHSFGCLLRITPSLQCRHVCLLENQVFLWGMSSCLHVGESSIFVRKCVGFYIDPDTLQILKFQGYNIKIVLQVNNA